MDGTDDLGGTNEPDRLDMTDPGTLGYDEEPEMRREVQAEIQDVLDQLHHQMAGSSVDDVVVAINGRLADAGIPEQPHRWVQVMAERIAAGLPPVADTRAAVDAMLETESGTDAGQP
jgi:hypothetical protein